MKLNIMVHMFWRKSTSVIMKIVFIKVMQSTIWYSMRRAVNLILTGRNISVNCVERGSSICTRKCRCTKEDNIKDTSDCLSLDVWIMLMHNTYGDRYRGSSEICYTFFIVHLPWVGIRVCMVTGMEHVWRYVIHFTLYTCIGYASGYVQCDSICYVVLIDLIVFTLLL